MKLPTWDDLQRDPDQLDVLEHPLDRSLFVAGPPGSGKTVLAVKRAQMLAERGAPPPIVTFNRMLRRLADLLNGGKTSAKTMHSFVYGDYKRRAGMPPPCCGPSTYDYDWERMQETLTGHTEISKENHLIIDEGQDLAEGFYRYANLHAAHVLTVFADEDQAYGNRRTTLEQIKDAANLPDPYLLKRNHRNTPEIARVAEHFHAGRLPAANVQRRAIGTRPGLVRTRGQNETADIIATWYRNRGGSVGVIVDSNPLGASIQGLLQARLPQSRIDRYDYGLQNEDLINVNNDGITVLNRESVKGQEFDSVFVLELEMLLPWRNDTMRRALYMICARARDFLTLVYGPAPLSADAVFQLPAPNILERP